MCAITHCKFLVQTFFLKLFMQKKSIFPNTKLRKNTGYGLGANKSKIVKCLHRPSTKHQSLPALIGKRFDFVFKKNITPVSGWFFKFFFGFLGRKLEKNWNCAVIFWFGRVMKVCISDFWHLWRMSDIVDCITGRFRLIYRMKFFPGEEFCSQVIQEYFI